SDPQMSKSSHAGRYGYTTAILSIFGNSVVLLVAAKKSSQLKPPELLTVNLAITDFCSAVTMYPLAVGSAWKHTWLGGDSSCKYYGFMDFFFGIASIGTLTVMAIVRFLVTSTTQNYGKIFRKHFQAIALVWLYALIWAVLPLVGLGLYGPEPFGISCTLAWSELYSSANSMSFIVASFILCTLLPTVIIATCYTGIAWKLHKISHHITRKIILSHMAVLVSLGFIGCWAPYATVSFWSIFNSNTQIPPVVSLLLCLFAKSSTVYNPIIYYTFSTTFQREAKKCLWCCDKKVHSSTIQDLPLRPQAATWPAWDNVQSLSIFNANQSPIRQHKNQDKTTIHLPSNISECDSFH
uniref:G-protein coupled receptors family 1 profile domain-containing protein n=1 Tax=Callorhinchus milii TaxID=7868 RepID=A0A4W3I712_CALMI